MTIVSSNVDSRYISGMFTICAWCCFRQRRHLQKVSTVKWQSCNKPHTLTTTIVVSRVQQNVIKRPLLWFQEKEKMYDWYSWKIHLFLYIKTPTHSWRERNEAWLNYSLNDESPWCVDAHDIKHISSQFSLVLCVHTDTCLKPFRCDACGNI